MNRATAQWAAMGTASAALTAGAFGLDLLEICGAVLLWWLFVVCFAAVVDSVDAVTTWRESQRQRRADAVRVYHVNL